MMRVKQWGDRLPRFLTVALVLGGAVVLAFTTTASSAVRLAATAYIMDGTTFPTPSPGFMQSAIDDFIAPTLGGSYSPAPLTTPEGVIGINQSVRDGVVDLEAAMAAQAKDHPGDSYVVFGYSQSAVITTEEKRALAAKKAAGQPIPPVTFVGIGVGNRPNGGIAERLKGLVIPFFDFTFDGAAPTDTGISSVDIARQYDGLADTPEFLSNPIADANAVLGVLFSHALYGEEVSLNPDSPKYVPGTVKQTKGDTTYYWIPTPDLPLLDPLRLIGVPEKVIDVFEPFVTELVEAGYDRSVPFGDPTPAQLIPVIDPVTLTLRLAGAALEGINNAAKLVGGALPGYAATADQLDALEKSSATAIGVPYRDAVTSINQSVNPIQAFDDLEGPVVAPVNDAVNATGIPKILNDVLAAVLTPFTAWGERNVLFPQSGSDNGGPIGGIARQFLKSVAPHLDSQLDEASPQDKTTSDNIKAPAAESTDPSESTDKSTDKPADKKAATQRSSKHDRERPDDSKRVDTAKASVGTSGSESSAAAAKGSSTESASTNPNSSTESAKQDSGS